MGPLRLKHTWLAPQIGASKHEKKQIKEVRNLKCKWGLIKQWKPITKNGFF